MTTANTPDFAPVLLASLRRLERERVALERERLAYVAHHPRVLVARAHLRRVTDAAIEATAETHEYAMHDLERARFTLRRAEADAGHEFHDAQARARFGGRRS